MQTLPKKSFEVKGENVFHSILPVGISSSPSGFSSSSDTEDSAEEDELFEKIVSYDTLINGNREIERKPDTIQFQRSPFRVHSSTHAPRVLPYVGAFTVQCAECFKWRLIPTKQKYEAIREHILELPFICEAAREWSPNISCQDPEDISQDDSMLWAIDKPNIAQPPPGWQRLLQIRGEGSTKFADVHYMSPSGKRLRSTVQIQKYLADHPEYIGVTMSQFSFQIPKPLRENYVRKAPSRCRASYDGKVRISRPLEPAQAAKKRARRGTPKQIDSSDAAVHDHKP